MSWHNISDHDKQLRTSGTCTLFFLSLLAAYEVPGTTAVLAPELPETARLEHYVQASDRIIIGMVTDKEIDGDTEYVWISVYQWLKNEVTNAGQIILDLDGSASNSTKEQELIVGEEVLLMLVDVDIVNGHFGLYAPDFKTPSKFPITLKDEVLSLVEKSTENKTREQKEDEDLVRLLNQSSSENCSIMEIEWTAGGRNDKFFYCTYEEEEMRFYVPISVTIANVKQELLKHVSDNYFDGHFNLRRAWDEAAINGKAEPVGQMLEFEYALDNFTFAYNVHVSLGYEQDDNTLLYMSYSPPKEITSSTIHNRTQIDDIIYGSNCLQPGTPYVLYDAAAGSHVDRGFSPVIGGRGPPDVFDRSGNQIREAEKRFQIWFDTAEILCTSNVNQDDEIDRTVGRQNQIILMDASNYVKVSDSTPLIVGIGVAIAGIIAFFTLRKFR